MKKTILLLLLILCCHGAASAQIRKGKCMLGGAIGYSKNLSPIDVNSFHISPSFEYFVSDSFSIGVAAGYEQYWNKSYTWTYGNYISGNEFISATGTIKYYKSITQRLYFGLGLELGYGYINSFISISHSRKDNNGAGLFILRLTPSLNYFLGPKCVLRLSLGGFLWQYGGEKFTQPNYVTVKWGSPEIGISAMF